MQKPIQIMLIYDGIFITTLLKHCASLTIITLIGVNICTVLYSNASKMLVYNNVYQFYYKIGFKKWFIDSYADRNSKNIV